MSNRSQSRGGFTAVEILVAVSLLAVVSAAGSMLFVSGQRLWSLVDGQISLQERARQVVQRVSFELMESGRDENGVLKLWVLEGAGPQGTDIVRFAIPLCVCGRSVIDENMHIRDWGAPLSWGQKGCIDEYPVGPNGKVTICKVPPGNPDNAHTIQVAPAAVKAHLATGSYLGSCDSCNPYSYGNRFVEYRLNASGQLVRRVLNAELTALTSVIIADQITGFRVFSHAEGACTVQVSLGGHVYPQQEITLTRNETVILRNY